MDRTGEKAPKRRITRQRRAILEYLRSTTSHPSASALYDEIRQRIPNISLGTIYRTLGILREEGAIQELSYDDYSRYDARTDTHYHIVCLSCGSVADADVGPEVKEMAMHVKAPGFRVVGHRLEFTGYCARCRDRAE